MGITDIEISVDKDSVKDLNIHLGFKRCAKFDDEAVNLGNENRTLIVLVGISLPENKTTFNQHKTP